MTERNKTERRSRIKEKEQKNRTEVKESENWDKKNNVMIKVGVIGETHTGKTSLMVKYVEDRFDREYIETLGVNFMERTIKLKNTTVTLSVWDLGGQDEYKELMPLVCNDAKVILYVFDLTRKKTLSKIKGWFRNAKKYNKYAIPFLIGSKFDLFNKKDMQFKQEITDQAKKFARLMKAPLIYCSASRSINIKKIFQIIIAKVFHLVPRVAEVNKCTEPIVEYKASWGKRQRRKEKGNKSTSKRRDPREKKRPEQ